MKANASDDKEFLARARRVRGARAAGAAGAGVPRQSSHARPPRPSPALSPPSPRSQALGVDDVLGFEFVSPPPRDALVAALEQLLSLGALDQTGALSKYGRVPFASLLRPLCVPLAPCALPPASPASPAIHSSRACPCFDE